MKPSTTPVHASVDQPQRGLALASVPKAIFDRLVRQAAAACAAPVALLTLQQGGHEGVQAQVGWAGAGHWPGEPGFGALTGLVEDGFEVEDTRLDARFKAHPWVIATPELRFFAGVPLVLATGERVGGLWVGDVDPRRLTAAQTQSVQDLAAVAAAAWDMHLALQRAADAAARFGQATAGALDERFRSMVEHQHELISLAQADGKLVYVNAAYARHFGRTPQELIGTDLFELIDPQDREPVRRAIAGVFDSGAAYLGENGMIDAQGRVRIVAWTNSVQHEAGQADLLRSVGRDITEHRLAESALRETTAFNEEMSRVSGVGGWSLELATGRIKWSEQTCRIHEVAPGFEPTLEAAIAFYSPAARPVVAAAVQRAVSEGTAWDLELELDTAGGRRIWARSLGEAECEAGRAVRLIGTFQDITARRALESRLSDSERFIRELTDYLPVRIAYLDPQRRYRFVNRELVQRFGLSRDNILGRTRAELLPGTDHGELTDRAQAVLQGQPQQFEFDDLVAGQLRRIENRLIPDLDQRGQVRGFFVAGIDITERSMAENAARELTAIVENSIDLVVQSDRDGHITYLNPAARRAFGWGSGEVGSGHHFTEFNTPATNLKYEAEILPALRRDNVWVGQIDVYGVDRRVLSVSHMVLAHRDAQGRIARFSAVMRDISATLAAQEELQRQSAILRSVADAMPATIAVISNEGRYRFVNQAFATWWRRPVEQIVGLGVRELLGEAEFARRKPWVDRALAGEAVDFELEYTGTEQSSHQLISYIPLRLEDGQNGGFVVITHDVSSQRHEARRLKQLAQRDPLTGLLNRAGFEHDVEHALALSREQGLTGWAVLYIDLDQFKPVNDQHGHPVGDQVLMEFGRRLNLLVRPSDVVARLGGDEFAIVLTGIREREHAEKIADKVVAAAQEPFVAGDLRLQIGTSVGVAWEGASGVDWRVVVARADAQLLRAKAAGRGQQSTLDSQRED